MSDEGPAVPPPTWRDFEALASRLSQVIRANTNTLRQVHAIEMANAKAIAELQATSSSLRASSASSADLQSGKVDIVIELLRDSRASTRDLLSEARATNEKLGVTQDEISQLRMSDRYTPMSVPLLPKPRDEEATQEPLEGITVRNGRLQGSVGLGTLWQAARRHGPTLGWVSGAFTAAWHALKHFIGH